MAKIIRDSVAYAGELGLRPDKDLRQAMVVLGDSDPDACLIEIPLGGPEGKPYFFAGPYDNVDRIMKILTEKLGSDGFHYTLPMDGMFDDSMSGDGMISDEMLEAIHEHDPDEDDFDDGLGDPNEEDDQTIVLDESDYKAAD